MVPLRGDRVIATAWRGEEEGHGPEIQKHEVGRHPGVLPEGRQMASRQQGSFLDAGPVERVGVEYGRHRRGVGQDRRQGTV